MSRPAEEADIFKRTRDVDGRKIPRRERIPSIAIALWAIVAPASIPLAGLADSRGVGGNLRVPTSR